MKGTRPVDPGFGVAGQVYMVAVETERMQIRFVHTLRACLPGAVSYNTAVCSRVWLRVAAKRNRW